MLPGSGSDSSLEEGEIRGEAPGSQVRCPCRPPTAKKPGGRSCRGQPSQGEVSSPGSSSRSAGRRGRGAGSSAAAVRPRSSARGAPAQAQPSSESSEREGVWQASPHEQIRELLEDIQQSTKAVGLQDCLK